MVRPLPPFSALVDAHGAELMRYAKRLVGPTAAEDVLQESLLRALRSYPRLRNAEHLRAWLYRITTTTAFDHSASRKKTKEVSVETVPEPWSVDHRDDGFEAVIDGLPEGPRKALTLRFVEDLSYDDMSARLGCSPEAARQRVSSAIRTLRGRMK